MLSNDIKLLAVFDKLEARITKLTLKQGDRGIDGEQGKEGAVGKQGPKGATGDRGAAGVKGETGKEGKEGKVGVSITDVRVDFDNHLVVSFSDGRDVDAGEIRVESAESNYNVSMGGSITAPLPSISLITENAYTTLSGPLEEIIKCTGSTLQTITLHPAPTQGQRRTIKRLGTGTVTVVGTVDGETSTSLGVDVSIQLIYIDNSWIII